MPEMRFRIRWPDGRLEWCYSPSRVIKDYLLEGESYALADFLNRSRNALLAASDRVQEKCGFPCPRALGELVRLQATARAYADAADARIKLEAFEP
jgi:uncharacterized repeat protein (TIGR04042 family)